MRVYIVDTGVQGSHVDFGGRVVNGHTVRARQSPPAYAPAHHSYNTTRPSTPPPPHPLTLSSSRIVPRAHRVRLVPSCQRHPPRRRFWVQRARHPRGLDRRWPKARRRQECDDRAGDLLLRFTVRLRRKKGMRLGGRCRSKPRVRPLRTCARLHRTTLTAFCSVSTVPRATALVPPPPSQPRSHRRSRSPQRPPRPRCCTGGC